MEPPTIDISQTVIKELSTTVAPLLAGTVVASTTGWFYFIVLLSIFIIILYIILYGLGISNVSNSWAENRCKPQIMPFASFYGYDTSENFTYCMSHIIKDQAGDSVGPIYQILGGFVGTIGTLIQSANSLRLSLATLVGGVTKVFQEFMERFNSLMTQLRITSIRMKMLFGRLFATFNSVIYMGMSGITAVSNFGDTFLFKFLDTFCFDPTTIVEINNKGYIPVRDVKLGDMFSKTGSIVTACFSFLSDGQPMVSINGIVVSTNHYIKMPNGKFAKAKEHPLAISIYPWKGGIENPLICFNTSNNLIPVGNNIFLDYDETSNGDKETMITIENIVNNTKLSSINQLILEYSPGFVENTKISLADNKFALAKHITLGQKIESGKVIGIIRKEVEYFVRFGEDLISASSLIWESSSNNIIIGKWTRAWKCGSIIKKKQYAYSFIVSPSATIITKNGLHIRDYIEVLSPDSEEAYTREIHVLSR